MTSQSPGSSPDGPPARSLRRRVSGGLAWTFAGQQFVLISGVLIAGIATRILDPADAGIYFLAVSIAGTFASTVSQGLGWAGIRLIAESVAADNPGRARAAIGNVWRIAIVATFVLGVALVSPPGRWLISRAFQSPKLGEVIVLVALLMVFQGLGRLRADTFRGLQEFRLASLFSSVDTNLAALAVLGMLYLLSPEAGTLLVVLGIRVGAWVPGLVFGGNVLRRHARRLVGLGHVGGWQVMAIAWPMVLTGVGAVLQNNGGLWVAGAGLSAEDAALFGAAIRLLAIVSIPFIAVNAVLPAFMSELYTKGDIRRLQKMVRTAASMAAVPAIATQLVFVFGADAVLAIVFGEFYRGASLVLVALGAGHVLNICFGSCGLLLTMAGSERLVTWVSVANGVGVVVLGGLGAVIWGLEGVAVAVAAGTTIKNVVLWLAARRIAGVWTHLGVPRPGEFRGMTRTSDR